MKEVPRGECREAKRPIVASTVKILKELSLYPENKTIDRTVNSQDRAFHILQFAINLMDISSEAITTDEKNPHKPMPRIDLVRPNIAFYLGPEHPYDGVGIYSNRTINYNGKNYPVGARDNKLQEDLNNDWAKGKRKLINQLAKLSKRGVIKKFEKAIKI